MIPADWRRHHRADGELIGYLAPVGGDSVVPMTLLGTPVGEPCDEWVATERLDNVGLGYLADRWMLRLADGTERAVVLVEVDAGQAVLAPAEFALVVGVPRDESDRIVIDLPTDRLRRA
ncbi:MAG TPA: hypothetical protein VNZ66_00885 [Aeromicrobium sp.]|nr:hypothetical protein [Aeromicrobium sp.]